MTAFLRGILQPLQRVCLPLYAITTCLHTSFMDDLLHLYNSPQTYPLVSRVMSFVSFIQTETHWDDWTIGGSALLIGLEVGHRFAEYQYVATWSARELLLSDLARFAFYVLWFSLAACNAANKGLFVLVMLRSVLLLIEVLMSPPSNLDQHLFAEQSEAENEDESDDGYRRYYDGHHYDPRYESDYESDHDYTQSKFF